MHLPSKGKKKIERTREQVVLALCAVYLWVCVFVCYFGAPVQIEWIREETMHLLSVSRNLAAPPGFFFSLLIWASITAQSLQKNPHRVFMMHGVSVVQCCALQLSQRVGLPLECAAFWPFCTVVLCRVSVLRLYWTHHINMVYIFLNIPL